MDENDVVSGSFTPPPPGGTNVSLLIGPVLMGYMLSYLLLGVVCVQIYLYHTAFPRDPVWMKLYVWAVFFLEMVLAVLVGLDAWWSIVSGFGDLSHMSEQRHPTSAAEMPLTALIALMIHWFYCWRIVKLTGRFLIVVLIMIFSLAHLSLAIYIGAVHGMNNGELGRLYEIADVSSVLFATGVAGDIVITLTLVSVLYKARLQTVFYHTSTMLQRLMVCSVETALVTSCWAAAQLILFHTREHTGVYFLFCAYIIPRLYSITFMATLNSRMNIRGSNNASAGSQTGLDFQGCQHTAFWQDLETQAPSSPTAAHHETHEMAGLVFAPVDGRSSHTTHDHEDRDVAHMKASHSPESQHSEPVEFKSRELPV